MSTAASAAGAAIGAVVALVSLPLLTMLVARPPLVDLPDGMEAPPPLGLPLRCASCRTPIPAARAVPLLGSLRGSACRSCSAPLPRWMVPTEVGAVLLLALVGARIGVRAELAAFLVAAAVCVPVVVTDLQHHRIATRLVYPATAVVLALFAVAAAAHHDGSRLLRTALGGLAASAFIWVLVLIHPGGMGAGDARLCLLLGMPLAWWGWSHVYLGLLAGFMLGSVVGLALVAARRGGRKTQFAFGPWLCAGALALSLFPQLAA